MAEWALARTLQEDDVLLVDDGGERRGVVELVDFRAPGPGSDGYVWVTLDTGERVDFAWYGDAVWVER